jgi:hypothetical protein
MHQAEYGGDGGGLILFQPPSCKAVQRRLNESLRGGASVGKRLALGI